MKTVLQSFLVFLVVFGMHFMAIGQSTYSMKIDISEQASVALTNYQVDLFINTQSLVLQGKMNANGSDIRFYSDSCLTAPLSHWVESGMNTATTQIWVRIPSIPANTVSTVYMGYGDQNATDLSNFTTTFPNAIVSNGGPLNLTGNIVADWFQLDATDALTLGSGAPLSITARKILMNGTVVGNGAGSAGGAATASFGQIGSGPGGGTPSNPLNSGSGGGSYGGLGGTGGFDRGDSPGIGGLIYGTVLGSDIDMGSGGGASDLSFGGAGGGSLSLNAEFIDVAGNISMNGAQAQQPGSGRGGGGGSGGGVLLFASKLTVTGSITADGGQGSIGTSSANDDGGGGSGGRIKLFYTNSGNITGTLTVNGGTVGSFGTGGPPQPGAVGTVHQEALIALDNLVISTGPEISLTHTATILSSGSVCLGDSVLLSAGGNYSSFEWSTNETLANIYVSSDGTYQLIAGAPGAPIGCGFVDTAVITVFFNPLPSVDLGADTVICVDASITLNAGAGFTSYLWNTNAITPTIVVNGSATGLGTQSFFVEVSDTNGCQNTSQINIVVDNCGLGLAEADWVKIFDVYPNPFTDNLNVILELTYDSITELSVHDMSGKCVYNQSIIDTNNIQNLDVSGLQSGTYFVEISNTNGRLTRMLVKN